jgi:hypothetical protein
MILTLVSFADLVVDWVFGEESKKEIKNHSRIEATESKESKVRSRIEQEHQEP